MKLSVIIPAYNEEKNIATCLQSLIEQEEPADEIIIIDNNCTDQTVEIAEKYNVKVIQEKVQGMIPARNRGFNEAQYEIIARTDADTVLPKTWIKRIKNDFENNNIDGVSGPFYYYDLVWHLTILPRLYMFIAGKLVHSPILFGPNLAIKKSMWNKIKDHVCLNDKQVHEDIDLSIHISKQGGKILFDSKLIIPTSARRILKNPWSFFFEYTKRLINTVRIHKSMQF